MRYIIFFFLIISANIFSQKNIEKVDSSIFILIDKCSNAKIVSYTKDSVYYETYRLNWPTKPNYKMLSLKKNADGSFSQSIKILGEDNSLFLEHVHSIINFTSCRIEKKMLYDNMIIRYSDFVFYDSSLLDALLKSKNIYIILEEEFDDDYFIAKKVKIIN